MDNRKLNILTLISYAFIPYSNSGGKALNYFFSKYLNFNHNSFVISTDNNEQLVTTDFRLIPIIKSNELRYLPFNYTLKLVNEIKSKKIDKIFCIQPFMAPAVILAGYLSNKKINLYAHNIESQRFKSIGKIWWPILYIYECIIMHLSSQIFFVTNEDKDWAIQNYFLKEEKCHFAPYGTELTNIPNLKSKPKKQIAEEFGLNSDKEWVYFIGSMNYFPNYTAVKNINQYLVPKLKENKDNIQILIMGSKLESNIQDLLIPNNEQIKYLGFVENIEEIIAHCGIMLNPTLTGGGIKTKAIEALAYNKRIISFENAACGINKESVDDMAVIVKDHNWNEFYYKLIEYITKPTKISTNFYNQYTWTNIVNNILEKMN